MKLTLNEAIEKVLGYDGLFKMNLVFTEASKKVLQDLLSESDGDPEEFAELYDDEYGSALGIWASGAQKTKLFDKVKAGYKVGNLSGSVEEVDGEPVEASILKSKMVTKLKNSGWILLGSELNGDAFDSIWIKK